MTKPMYCGASILTDRVLLTAAHCLMSLRNITDDPELLSGHIIHPSRVRVRYSVNFILNLYFCHCAN